MGKVSTNFSRKEFACKCGCGFSTVDVELISVIQDVRTHFEEPTIINSGCRCEYHNKIVGGADNSKHKEGIAADIRVNGVPEKELYTYLDDKYPHKYGIGLYKGRVHIDIRPIRSRWIG